MTSAFADAVLDDLLDSLVESTPHAILAQGVGFVSAFEEIGLYENFVHVIGNEAVTSWQSRGVAPDGTEVTIDGINRS